MKIKHLAKKDFCHKMRSKKEKSDNLQNLFQIKNSRIIFHMYSNEEKNRNPTFVEKDKISNKSDNI